MIPRCYLFFLSTQRTPIFALANLRALHHKLGFVINFYTSLPHTVQCFNLLFREGPIAFMNPIMIPYHLLAAYERRGGSFSARLGPREKLEPDPKQPKTYILYLLDPQILGDFALWIFQSDPDQLDEAEEWFLLRSCNCDSFRTLDEGGRLAMPPASVYHFLNDASINNITGDPSFAMLHSKSLRDWAGIHETVSLN